MKMRFLIILAAVCFLASPQIRRRILRCICRAKVQSEGTQSRSFKTPQRQAQAYLEENYARSVSFRRLARTFLAAHADDFTTRLFLAGSPALRNHGARRRPRSFTDFQITIKTHSPLLSTKTKTDFLFRNGFNWYDRGGGRASAVLRKLRVRHCQNWQAVPDRIAPTHQRL